MRKDKTDAVVGAMCLFVTGVVIGLVIAYFVY